MSNPRIALHLGAELIGAVSEVIGGDANETLGAYAYVVFQPLDDAFTEFNMKLMTEDEIVEAVKSDSSMHIMTLPQG